MAIPVTPSVASRPPWLNVTPLQGTPVTLTANVTNTATTATQVTGLTNTFIIKKRTVALVISLQIDSVSNSAANAVLLTLWNGTVGSGTQVGQFTDTAASGTFASMPLNFYIPVTPAMWDTSITLNVGMHGSGAGTNTLAAGTVNPCNFYAMAY